GAMYGPPRGRILLAHVSGEAAGCVALRALEPGTFEMKRVYVRPAFRGTGLGRRLALAVIETARVLGYARMRIDTLPQMQAARRVYTELCFRGLDTAQF